MPHPQTLISQQRSRWQSICRIMYFLWLLLIFFRQFEPCTVTWHGVYADSFLKFSILHKHNVYSLAPMTSYGIMELTEVWHIFRLVTIHCHSYIAYAWVSLVAGQFKQGAGGWLKKNIYHLTSIGNPIVEIRRSCDRLICTMWFPILVKHLYIEL